MVALADWDLGSGQSGDADGTAQWLVDRLA